MKLAVLQTVLQKKLGRLLFQKNVGPWLYCALLLCAVVLRMGIAASQRVYLLPEASGLDDMLMIRAAQSFTEGNWLGAYGAFAMAKNMGFSLWLALLHQLHIPVLLGNTALWLLACGFAVWALRPLFKGNFGRFLLFIFLAFQPLSYAFFTQRVYRDAVFPAVSLLFFAGMLGLCLRLAFPSARGSLLAALGAGLGFAAGWLTREDGPVLLVFALASAAVLAAFVLFSKQVQRRAVKLLCVALPFVVLGVGVVGFSAANKAYFGVFMVSDLTEGSFPSAYGALVAVSAAESGFVPVTPVPHSSLEKLYQEVPAMAELQPWLQRSEVLNGFANAETGEYGGSFYYALRYAADGGGFTPNAEAAQKFWARLGQEVEQAVQQGRLRSERASSSTLPRWHHSLLAPTATEIGRNLLALFTFKGTVGPDNIRPIESVGPPEKVQAVADYLYSPVQQGYIEGSQALYYNPLQKASFALCDGLTWVYRILLWPLAALALFCTFNSVAKTVGRLFRRQNTGVQLPFVVLLLGLVCSVLLRSVVAGYMEVAAFHIGVYLMYMSGAMPPLLLFLAAAIAQGFATSQLDATTATDGSTVIANSVAA